MLSQAFPCHDSHATWAPATIVRTARVAPLCMSSCPRSSLKPRRSTLGTTWIALLAQSGSDTASTVVGEHLWLDLLQQRLSHLAPLPFHCILALCLQGNHDSSCIPFLTHLCIPLCSAPRC